MAIDLGDVVSLAWAYGSATTAVCTVTLPDGSTATPAVTGTTSFAASYQTTAAGFHTVRWVGTGSNPGAYVDTFNVDAIAAAPIIGLAEAKTFLQMAASSTDEDLREVLEAVSDICEDRTRQVWRRTIITNELHDGGDVTLHLRRGPVISTTSVSQFGTGVSDYVLDGPNALLHRGTTVVPYLWWPGQRNISVSYVAGPADGVIPARIRRGCKTLARHLWDTQRGGTGQPRQAGGPNGEYDPRTGFTIPNAVIEMWGQPSPMVR